MKRLLAVLLSAMVAVVFVAGCSSKGANLGEAKDALEDAAACANELAERYKSYSDASNNNNPNASDADADDTSDAGSASDADDTSDAAGSASSALNGAVGESGDASEALKGTVGTGQDDAKDSGTDTTQNQGFEKILAEIDTYLERIQADIDAVQKVGGSWEGREQAIAAMENLQGALSYERDIMEAEDAASKAPEGAQGTAAVIMIMSKLLDGYNNITPPDCLKAYLQNTIDTMPTVYAALTSKLTGSDSTLATYTTNELFQWWITKQSAYDQECNDILVKQCEASGNMLNSILDGTSLESAPTVEADMIDQIAPNLYPSLDSVANLGITSFDDAHSVNVEAEVVGFSQKFQQKYDLAQGYNYLPIKPALLPSKDLTNLTSNSTTQLNIKVTDAQSGEVLAQESHPIDLLSIYDFKWSNDEFGVTAAFDILAWLRPQCDEANAINRAAADVLGDWTNGKFQSIVGYTGPNASDTLIQVAAIQKAMSDAGISYVWDSYSFTSDQHVLTPDAVVKKRQGLCIETSLLMASCLMSAGMHPLIIITPGHAQVAIESYSGSGKYYLIETTKLPYDGLDTSKDYTKDMGFYGGLIPSAKTDDGSTYYWTTTGSPAEWQLYFNSVGTGRGDFGGIFVIDCALQQVMGIQGLENV
ncbi:MAG: hypothetical protein Q4A01_06420 [Coriobacteriales bacterium]|nr:hypothetical protein [Coriobacteriales bacterium]